ncbi:MAG: PAS domain-containing protein [Rhodospirillales bacterium]|nr:PAS domain-containing protein [Rhodospirillales bacterium]
MGFKLVSELRLNPASGSLPHALAALLGYWDSRRAGRPMPERADIDPSDLGARLGRIHLLDVEGPQLFRYRVYGSRMTNPDARDMTGRTTGEYADATFGAMVTRHLAQCVLEKVPVCYEIHGRLDEDPYIYTRIALPLAGKEGNVAMILVGSERGSVPARVQREF